MDFAVLGPLEVRDGDRVVGIRRGIPRVLLEALVVHRGEVVSFDALVEAAWGDELPANPANALQTQIAYLRRRLGSSPIVTRPTGYVLDVPDEAVDAVRFERLVARGRRLALLRTAAPAAEALAAYDAALALWRGLAYEEVADRPFAEAEAVRLEELRLSAAAERVDVLLALGRTAEAVADATALTTAHPLREQFHEQLVLGLYRSGRQAEALRACETARRILAEELGLDPGPGLRRLQRQMLDQDPELEWTPLPGEATVRGAGPSSPAAAPALIGRHDELARVVELLGTTSLLTLTGPGGAGKTTLALAATAAITPSRPVVFIDLAAVERDGPVAASVASAVGADVSPAGDVVDAVAARLAGTGAIVVLDTCEHVVDGARRVAEGLVQQAAGVTVLATSRRPLQARRELVWPVPPLGLPTAVELFVTRAREVVPDLDVSSTSLEHVEAICRSLDGLPLAIELAAAHVDVFPPEVMRDHPMLGGGSTETPERQRTLRSTIEWSVRLLHEHERTVLFRLAVLAGGFDVDAVVAIGGAPDVDATAALVALVRASLVTTEASGGRYRLFDTVRAYVLDEADEAVLADARRRHAAHFTAVAEAAFARVRGPGQRDWIVRMRADLANIRAALEWCFGPDGDERLGARLAGTIAWVWTLDGQLVEASAALEHAEQVEGVDPRIRARVLLGIGLLAAPLGDLARALEACLESAALARAADDPYAVADALITVGVAHWGLGDLEASVAAHDEAIELFESARNLWGATVCRVLRARTAMDLHDLVSAEKLLDIAIEDARTTGDAHVVGLALDQHARLALLTGDVALAEVATREALAANESIGYAEGVVAAHSVMGRILASRGERARSRAHHLQALETATRIAHAAAQCEALEAIAALDAEAGDVEGAALLLLHAARVRERRSLALRSTDAERIGRVREQVRGALGGRWEGMERLVPLTSFDDLVRRVLAGA